MAYGVRERTRRPSQQLAVEHAGLAAGKKSWGSGRTHACSSQAPLLHSTEQMTRRIIYLGPVANYDRDLARLLLHWLYDQTGNRGLIVVHRRGTA